MLTILIQALSPSLQLPPIQSNKHGVVCESTPSTRCRRSSKLCTSISQPNPKTHMPTFSSVSPLQTQPWALVTFIYLKPVADPAAYAAFRNLTPVSDATGLTTLH